MSKINDGGSAFPRPNSSYEGMSLKEYYVGQAIAGLGAVENLPEPREIAVKVCASWAVALADAVLAELRKEK